MSAATICPVCAKPVKQRLRGSGAQKVYCSDKCRWKAHHRRFNARNPGRNAWWKRWPA